MKLQVILRSHKIGIIVTSILILLFAYIVLKFTFPGTDPLVKFLSYITNPYLLFVEKFANMILYWKGSLLTLQNHSIYLNGMLIDGFTTKIMYKKATIFYISLLWLTRTSTGKKICFTGIYLILSFLSATLYIVTEAYAAIGDSKYASIFSTHSIVFFCMNTILLIWYLINKKSHSVDPANISEIAKLLDRKLLDIIILLFGYSIILFSLDYFYFNQYINFLLKSAQKILGILGYNSVVESDLLIGNNGSISVYRTCLGFITMFLFASLVYLTGNKHKRGWGYIIFGLLILNLANILRIVFLFIHLQKHGDYLLAMDIHDLYNYIIYFIVFVLWVIWFERLMDLKTIKSIRSLLRT